MADIVYRTYTVTVASDASVDKEDVKNALVLGLSVCPMPPGAKVHGALMLPESEEFKRAFVEFLKSKSWEEGAGNNA